MIQLLYDDCVNALPRMASESFDFIFCDPWYEFPKKGRQYKLPNTSYKGTGKKEAAADPDVWMKECYRLLKPSGNMIVMTTFHGVGRVEANAMQAGFEKEYYRDIITWWKTNPMPCVHCSNLTHATEFMSWFTKGPNYYFDYLYTKSITGKQHHNVLHRPICSYPEFVKDEDNKVVCQQQKPLWLLQFLLNAFCPPSGRVLDPFSGVATALMACRETGRNGIGIENDPKVYWHAHNRLWGEVA